MDTVNKTIYNTLIIKSLGKQDYMRTFQAMKDFTENRTESSLDEIWLVEHPSVFTLGRNGKTEHILDVGDIPVIQTDRGGQVTYHGEGQLVAYLLLDIKRRKLGVRKFVNHIENAIIQLLSDVGVNAESRANAPGVYVDNKKIAALGLRISKGRSYHGLSLNINMDLSPFQRIHPCGYKDLKVTQCTDLGLQLTMASAGQQIIKQLSQFLGYQHLKWMKKPD